ncbi:hypothetical protein V9K67_05570 [Paraflavisolibacter sp. H34]|uniref:hypothetical protein n=1 Tax=Huijunlia imazamoxiresistens TaxID=3127457 RepID=UPI003019F046
MVSAGKILYKVYYQPVGAAKKILKTGIRRHLATEAGRKEMILAAESLRELSFPGAEAYSVYFLTGSKYWYQTAFCLYSLQRQSGRNIHACIVDDGSFDDALEHKVLTAFPSSVVVRKEALEKLLEEHLPARFFPVLRHRRLEYPHIRKLTDIHILPGRGPKLVMDSDMLFFHKPEALLQWLRHPRGLLFLKDSEQSYGYTTGLMQHLCQSPHLPSRLNVGIAGIPSEKVDWKELERWTAELQRREGTHYLQEQALTAMIAAREPYTFLSEKAYKVQPVIQGDPIPEVLHHYVADSKYDYFVKGWRKIIS